MVAGLVYLVFFDSFSETELIQLSALWLAPVAFGIAGYFSDSGGGKHPVTTAFMWAGGAVAALVLFIFGIFPAL